MSSLMDWATRSARFLLNNHIGLTRRLRNHALPELVRRTETSVAGAVAATARFLKVGRCDIFANDGLRGCQALERNAGSVCLKQIQNNSGLPRRRLMHCVG